MESFCFHISFTTSTPQGSGGHFKTIAKQIKTGSKTGSRHHPQKKKKLDGPESVGVYWEAYVWRLFSMKQTCSKQPRTREAEDEDVPMIRESGKMPGREDVIYWRHENHICRCESEITRRCEDCVCTCERKKGCKFEKVGSENVGVKSEDVKLKNMKLWRGHL